MATSLHHSLIIGTIRIHMKNYNYKDIVEFRIFLNDKGLTAEVFRKFRAIIKKYFRKHGRHDLPWRNTENPYHIFVSEIMLQQTQVERVKQKYEQFLEQFPDFSLLADASLRTVLKQWQGLGYNRRAMALHNSARAVMIEYHGSVPSSVDELISLPGVGRATAASIAAFAFNRPSVFIETNIRRVFIYFFFPGKKNIKDADLLPLVEKTLVRSGAREWYYALMDYGSMLKKEVENPNSRSAHYKRQSRFEGSNRQVRGMILKALIHDVVLTEKEIARKIKAPIGRTRSVLEQLCSEGFLIRGEEGYRVP